MMQDLKGKSVLVTGGGHGIGRTTALAFAAAGARVAVADIDAAAAEEAAQECNRTGGEALGLAVDVSQEEAVREMVAQVVARFGRLDIAFNNAGIEMEHEPLARAEEAMFDRLTNVNIKGVWLCMKHEIQQMLAQGGGGSIVNTASVAGFCASTRQPIYGATKHAVVGLTKSAALEYGRKGVRVNAVCPGVIRTAMTERALEREPRRAKMIERFHPIGRLGESEDIANAVLFLSSDAASFILGHCLPVDGGFLAQ